MSCNFRHYFLYKNSEERKKNAQKRLQDKYAQQLLYGNLTDSTDVLYDEDPKEKELQAQIDYWDHQIAREEDEKLFASNMQLIQSLNDAERAAFEKYANGSIFVNAGDVEAYKALQERYGDKLEDLKYTYQRNKEQQTAQKVAEKTAARMENSGVIGKGMRNVAAVGANIAGGVVGSAGRINELFNGTGPYQTNAPYTYGDIPSVFAQTVQEETTKDILGDQGMNPLDGISVREAGAMAYQGLMGFAETTGRILAAGGNPAIAAGLAAAQTFSGTMQQAAAQGASPAEAYALATINAGIEAATEKLPLEKLLAIAKGGAKPAAKASFKVLRQMGIEILEEEASLIGTTLAEMAILKEKSSYRQQVALDVISGKSMEQAEKDANMALLGEAANTAIVTAISSGLSAGGAEFVASRFGGSQDGQQTQMVQEQTREQAEKNKPLTEQELAQQAISDTLVQTDTQTGTAAEAAPEAQEQQPSNWMEQTFRNPANIATAFIGDPSNINEAPQSVNAANPNATSDTNSALSNRKGMQPIDIDTPGETSETKSAGTSINSMHQNNTEVNGNPEIYESAPMVDTHGQSAEGGQVKGTGAAEENFSGKPSYYATLSEDNAQRDRVDDVRLMELPETDINGNQISAVTGNVYGSRITPDDFASLMEEPTARGDFSYAKISNDRATQMAAETIARGETWERAYDIWKQDVTRGNAGAEMSARGALFLNRAAQQGDKGLWLETLHYMQELGTNTAQGLQAMRIIRMTPSNP